MQLGRCTLLWQPLACVSKTTASTVPHGCTHLLCLQAPTSDGLADIVLEYLLDDWHGRRGHELGLKWLYTLFITYNDRLADGQQQPSGRQEPAHTSGDGAAADDAAAVAAASPAAEEAATAQPSSPAAELQGQQGAATTGGWRSERTFCWFPTLVLHGDVCVLACSSVATQPH
jgi:hypothetical protein